MKRLIILQYLRLRRQLRRRMTEVSETMQLTAMSETYARYVCRMNGWEATVPGGYTKHFCEVDLAFVNGYIKALHDNRLEFQNGLVRRRDITHEMPCGALDYYRADAIRDTKQACRDVLRQVLSRHVDSLTNVNYLMAEYDKEMKNVKDK